MIPLFFILATLSIVLAFFIYAFYYYKRLTHLLQKQAKRIMKQQVLINRQNEKLLKAIESRNKLFSIIAHDLRSPIVAISNLSNLIELYAKNRQYEAIPDIAKQLNGRNANLLELTDNLLNWAKSQTEQLIPVFEKVCLGEVVKECFRIYEVISMDKGISLTYREQGEARLIMTDRNMLKTIIRNLVNNAIKYTPRNGKVEVICQCDHAFAQITVQDNGIGIPREKMQTLFEVDVSHIQDGTEGEKSSGLGLSICKEFAVTLGGKISVESQENAGSCFIVAIPLYHPATEFLPASASAEEQE